MTDFYLAAECGDYERGFRELLSERGYSLAGGMLVCMEIWDANTIHIELKDGKAVIKAPQKTMVFRGLMELVRKVEKEGDQGAFVLEEEVYIMKNGAMADCSRGSVLQVEAVKQLIKLQAALGMNTLLLYTEDTYEVKEYPYFGAYRGRYTCEEFRELDDYASVFGIEVIPCIQTLAHLQTALRWPEMLKLRDTEDIMMAGSQQVYDFIRACIAAVSGCFKSRRIHLGMDEAWSLGLGKYLHCNGYHSKAEIMSGHLEKVMAICRELQLEPMIWSDMYFRMISKDNEYYDVPLDSDLGSAVKPPEDVTLVYWDYYQDDKEFYKGYIGLHRQLSDKVVFAGGVWTWNGIAPNFTTAYKNSRAAQAACLETGLEESVCTMWQDDGAETPLFAGLPALVLYAEGGYAKEVTEERIREQFEFLTGVSYDAFLLLDRFDYVKGCEEKPHFGNPSKFLLYQDPLTGLFDGQVSGLSMNRYYEELGQELQGTRAAFGQPGKSVAGCGKTMETILDMYEALARLLSVKAELGLQIRRAYRQGDQTALKRIAEVTIPECISLTEAYRQLREDVWMLESRIFGFEVLDIRLNGVKGRLGSAAGRIGKFLDGTLASLPEMEEEMQVYSPGTDGEEPRMCSANVWRYIVSASNI